MGAWGHTNFENDDASDFLRDFREVPTENFLMEALALVVEAGEEGEYIEAPEASVALAAAELVAALGAKPSPDLPEDVRTFLVILAINKITDIQKIARRAVKQVLKESELQELWAEGGEPNEWQAVQKDLLERLR